MKAKSTQEQYVGDIFETFVGLILSKLYPDYTFEHTKYKHDGGKDFYAVFSDEKIWAEAKCCSRHLELSRIAGTFIMAEIFKITPLDLGPQARCRSGQIDLGVLVALLGDQRPAHVDPPVRNPGIGEVFRNDGRRNQLAERHDAVVPQLGVLGLGER